MLGVGGIRDVGLHLHRVGQLGRERSPSATDDTELTTTLAPSSGEGDGDGDGGADPARRAGDEGDAPFQVAHDWCRGEAMG
jgi:hypothetical protein